MKTRKQKVKETTQKLFGEKLDENSKSNQKLLDRFLKSQRNGKTNNDIEVMS